MPISPYSTPIQFEYKPLGLEGFAKPLSEMQTQYDDTLNKVDALDFDIQALSKDDPAAKEKINALMEQRNQLRDELMNTKNFKQGARKVLDLNRQYTKDEDIQSIQSNAKNWQEYDKLEKERYLKGDISREEYESNRAVRMGEYAGYKEGNINTIPLSKNEEENIRKDVDAALKATADQTKYTYIDGIDEVTNKKIRETTKETWKGINQIAREVRALILTSDKYKEFYNSRADLAWRSYKLAGKEEDIAASTYQADIANTTNKITAAQSELDRLTKLKESGRYSGEDLKNIEKGITQYTNTLQSLNDRITNVQSALETGNVNPQVAKRLFEDQFLEGKVNSLVDANADLYDYNTVKQDLQYTTIDDGGAGDGSGINGSSDAAAFIPNTFSGTITNENLQDVTKKLRKGVDDVYDELDSRTRADGTSVGIFNQLFGNQDRGSKAVTTNAIYQAIRETKTEGGNAVTFASKLAEKGIGGYDQKKLDVIYNKFSSPDGLTTLSESVGKIQRDIARIEEVKGMQRNATEQILKSNDFKNNEDLKYSGYNYNNAPENLAIKEKHMDAASKSPLFMNFGEKADVIINSKNSTSEEKLIAKAYKVAYERDPKYFKVTNEDIAKVAGYNNVEDAILKGFKFPTSRINDYINTKMNDALKTSTYLSTLSITGDTKEAKLLRATINDRVTDVVKTVGIDGLVPAFADRWTEEEGLFEEVDGKPTFVGEVVGKSTVSKSDRNIYITTTVKNKETGATKTIHTLFPENDKLIEKEIYKNIYETSNPDEALGKRNRNMAGSGMFDISHPDNPLTSSQTKSLQPTAEKPIMIYSYNIQGFGDAGKIRIFMNSKQKSGEKGKAHNYYTAKRYDPATLTWVPINVDEKGNIVFSGGKLLQTEDPNGIKSKLGSLYF